MMVIPIGSVREQRTGMTQETTLTNAPLEGSIDYSAQDGVATIRINRPAKRNAITGAMCEQLRAAWLRFKESEDRVALLCAQGDTFTAGADLTNPPADFWRAVPDVGLDIGKPVIAVVQGPVIGMGVTMLAFCDLCVAADDARFIYPEAKVGVAMGLITAIGARIPHKMAMELMLLGGPITAQRAYEVGFVNRVVPRGQEMACAMELALRIAASAPLVIKLLKDLTQQTLAHSPVETMYRTNAHTLQVQRSADAAEGLLAFKEKRAPKFVGK